MAQARSPEPDRSAPTLLVPGETCWRIEPTSRLAVLVDAASYFGALAAAVERARHSVLLVGWDFHSRVSLVRDGEGEGVQLAQLLDAAARQRQVDVRVLCWDWAMIYALERETLQRVRFGLRTHPRVRFRLDGAHPLGACHHQKIAVVDDALAFVGGIDLTLSRWDTREHRADDPRRRDPSGDAYPPFHDVQMAVDGAAARALAELARERWRGATGHRLAPPSDAPDTDPWPPGLEPALRDTHVGIARTAPAYEDRPAIREVEALWLAAVRGARQRIYLENQYLTSSRVADALCERLREPDGPEVVVVGPRRCSGWLEEGTMGVLRARLLRRLREADAYGRLHVYHPLAPGGADVNVHGKVLVVDERLLRVGSANLSNRSMGLDTECDLALEAGSDEEAATIAHFRDGLVAEHLGVEAVVVARELEQQGSLAAAIDALGRGERKLAVLDEEVPNWLDELVPESAVLDPERPVELERFLQQTAGDVGEAGGRGRLLRLAVGLVVVVGLAALWRWTPLGDWAAPERLTALAEPVRTSPAGPPFAALFVALAGLAFVPITALVVASGATFGWALGFVVALAGSFTSAALGYAVGAALWRDAVRRLAGERMNRLSRRLARHGVAAVAALRVVPVAPFTVVNLAAGSSHVRLRDFLLGTLLGMAPGALALCLVADGAVRAVSDPRPGTLALVLGATALVVAAALALRRWLERGPRERERRG